MTAKKTGGRMGRPPKPTEQKRLAGNPGRRPLPEPLQLVPAVEGPPSPPSDLQAQGKRVWRAVWKVGSQWLAPSDAFLVTLLCENADERAIYLKILSDEGRTYKTETGRKLVHPVVKELHTLEQQMVGILSLLGFSPSDRARLGLAEVKRMTHLADLVTRRRTELER